LTVVPAANWMSPFVEELGQIPVPTKQESRPNPNPNPCPHHCL
jgi:hypothetical protein